MAKSHNYRDRSFSVGEQLVITRDMEDSKTGLCKGDTVTIAAIENRGGASTQIGLKNNKPLEGWHDLGGLLDSGRGWWVSIKNVYERTAKLEENLTIDGGFSFKGRNLAGMPCKRLFQLEAEVSMVELAEDVGGGGGDGRGIKGRCIVVPNRKLKVAKKK